VLRRTRYIVAGKLTMWATKSMRGKGGMNTIEIMLLPSPRISNNIPLAMKSIVLKLRMRALLNGVFATRMNAVVCSH